MTKIYSDLQAHKIGIVVLGLMEHQYYCLSGAPIDYKLNGHPFTILLTVFKDDNIVGGIGIRPGEEELISLVPSPNAQEKDLVLYQTFESIVESAGFEATKRVLIPEKVES